MVRWLYLSGLVFAVLIPPGWQVAPKDLEELSRWKLFGSQNSQSFPPHVKRHSEGTFTSDFTRYLDRMKAKDFVHWLINTKRTEPTGELERDLEQCQDRGNGFPLPEGRV
ncbi:exendin-3-like [Aphelocoma coerulescens]|uniref:exendin-3-like n=1 Tax=Aphelocoma coerulescens TaxID=39617 RepID=UPI0036047663